MKPLRRSHWYIWLVLSVLLPFGILMAWLVIPNPHPIRTITNTSTQPLSIVKHSRNLPGYQVTIRTSEEESQWQLEWNNKKPLIVPSAVIYRLDPLALNKNSIVTLPFGQVELIGRIETTGTYLFELPVRKNEYTSFHFLLYDFIHEKVIDTINIHITSDRIRKKEDIL